MRWSRQHTSQPRRLSRVVVWVPAAVVLLASAAACTSDHHTATGSATSSPVTSSAVASSAVTSTPAAAQTAAASTSPQPITSAPQAATALASPPPAGSSSALVVNATPSATLAPPAPTASSTFAATIATVTAAELGGSWHTGCPVAPAQLRAITLSYWGFDNAPHLGTIVVNASVVPAVTTVFRTLFGEHFPIRRMEPTADFGGDDNASMAVDNTSGFNCRYAVTSGPPQWSAHAYGEAIDVNTVENPYVFEDQVLPPQGTPYATRSPYRPGMAVKGGELVNAFAAVGWPWGGRWSAPDYQHFSATGG